MTNRKKWRPTITDGVFSHIAQYKKYGHNNSTNCEEKYMARKLWTSSTSSYNFCPSKTMLKHWNGLKEMDLAFSHFCHARVTQNPIGTSQIFDPGMSPQTDTSLGVWTEAADFVTPSHFHVKFLCFALYFPLIYYLCNSVAYTCLVRLFSCSYSHYLLWNCLLSNNDKPIEQQRWEGFLWKNSRM